MHSPDWPVGLPVGHLGLPVEHLSLALPQLPSMRASPPSAGGEIIMSDAVRQAYEEGKVSTRRWASGAERPAAGKQRRFPCNRSGVPRRAKTRSDDGGGALSPRPVLMLLSTCLPPQRAASWCVPRCTSRTAAAAAAAVAARRRRAAAAAAAAAPPSRSSSSPSCPTRQTRWGLWLALLPLPLSLFAPLSTGVSARGLLASLASATISVCPPVGWCLPL